MPLLLAALTAAGSAHAATFPKELHGIWEDVGVGCDFDDSQSRISIRANVMYGYEKVVRPTHVVVLPGQKAAWRINTEVDIGPSGDFQEFGPINFSIEGGFLVSDYQRFVPKYKRCPVLDREGNEYYQPEPEVGE